MLIHVFFLVSGTRVALLLWVYFFFYFIQPPCERKLMFSGSLVALVSIDNTAHLSCAVVSQSTGILRILITHGFFDSRIMIQKR